MEIELWSVFEITLPGPVEGNPFQDIDLHAEFRLGHRQVTVRGFYDGDGAYKIRFMPDQTGTWQYLTHSNFDTLTNQQGEFTCIPPSGDNHGPLRVVERTHFAYADGTPYHPVGTTCYAWNHQGDAREQETLQTLAHAPFNKMRMCVFPKRYTFNHNEPPCYPFEGKPHPDWEAARIHDYLNVPPVGDWDFTRFNPAYFQRLEERILDLQRLGIEADLILFHPYDFGAWGFDRMPAEVNQRYLLYLLSRLAAFRNIWWSFANEYDLMFGRTMLDWDEAFKFVQANDPYDHLRSIHNCGPFHDHAKPWVTHCSIQHHSLAEVPRWLKQYGKPVVVDECGYEGDLQFIWGSLSAEEMVLRMWLGFVCGGAVGHGETYWNEDEVLWWSKGGKLCGESAPRIAFLREVIQSVPGYGLSPLVDSNIGQKLLTVGTWNIVSAGHVVEDYFLFYFGMHQPRFREFRLPDGSYRIDLLDTWNMSIQPLTQDARGEVRIELPRRKYLAVRIQRNT